MLGRALMIDLALSRVPDAALNAYGTGARAVARVGTIANGVNRFAHGSQAVKAMGANHVIAGEFFHGASDRRAALDAIDRAFGDLQADIETHATSPSDAAWALAEIVPDVAAWHAFAEKERTSQLGMWLTEWSAFHHWHAKVMQLRALARARGIVLQSEHPPRLPETMWERGERGAGSGLDKAFTLAKWIAYAAIGLLGFASLYSALSATNKEIAAEIQQ